MPPLCKGAHETTRQWRNKPHDTVSPARNKPGRGKGIYLLSNAQTDFTRPEIAVMGLEQYFDGILISSEIGYKKPAMEFYNALFTQYSLKPEECLMIGNDEGSDITGGIAAGMDTLYIHTEISPELIGESKAMYAVMDGDWRKARELLLRE